MRWYNILIAKQGASGGGGLGAPVPSFSLPYADPNTDNWHEGIFDFYSLCEVALGLRKEVSAEEAKITESYDAAEEALKRGDRDWRKHIGGDFSSEELDMFLGKDNNMDHLVAAEDKDAMGGLEDVYGDLTPMTADDYFKMQRED